MDGGIDAPFFFFFGGISGAAGAVCFGSKLKAITSYWNVPQSQTLLRRIASAPVPPLVQIQLALVAGHVAGVVGAQSLQ